MPASGAGGRVDVDEACRKLAKGCCRILRGGAVVVRRHLGLVERMAAAGGAQGTAEAAVAAAWREDVAAAAAKTSKAKRTVLFNAVLAEWRHVVVGSGIVADVLAPLGGDGKRVRGGLVDEYTATQLLHEKVWPVVTAQLGRSKTARLLIEETAQLLHGREGAAFAAAARDVAPAQDPARAARGHNFDLYNDADEDEDDADPPREGSVSPPAPAADAAGAGGDPPPTEEARLEDFFQRCQSGEVYTLQPDSRLTTRYHLASVLGQGGGGVVYKVAERAAPGRHYAVKRINLEMVGDSKWLSLLREATVLHDLCRLGNQHIVEVHGHWLDRCSAAEVEFDRAQDALRSPHNSAHHHHTATASTSSAIAGGSLEGSFCLYLLMELCEGGSLRDFIESGAPLPQVVSVARQVLSGLQAVHACGILHRDLKPSNVLLKTAPGAADVRVKIADFGLSTMTGLQHRIGEELAMAQRYLDEKCGITVSLLDGRRNRALENVRLLNGEEKVTKALRALHILSIAPSTAKAQAQVHCDPSEPPPTPSAPPRPKPAKRAKRAGNGHKPTAPPDEDGHRSDSGSTVSPSSEGGHPPPSSGIAFDAADDPLFFDPLLLDSGGGGDGALSPSLTPAKHAATPRRKAPRKAKGACAGQDDPVDGLTTNIGSPFYTAPEVHDPRSRAKRYTTAVDVFSVGVILYECVAGVRDASERLRLLSDFGRGNVWAAAESNSPTLVNLALRLAARSPDTRPSVADALAALDRYDGAEATATA
eukprot:TRINITY_DN21133_c0_g1_i1.p1 TRINITY_DN21133_c0_g1~~TRINITY_DN21133_c0_g1_i1.p1  ORF type:complete len:761 (+),score=229.41 TRINITY_DN21133_c0_g1_i1:84-2366(+)